MTKSRRLLPRLMLLLAALAFGAAVLAACAARQTTASPTSALVATAFPAPTVVPTLATYKLDLRLGEAANGTQLQRGAETYRLVCQDCHGDKGLGLTGEWLATWNPADQNCWQSKCHGDNHPDDGFKLPYYIPGVVGPAMLARYPTAVDLYNYITLTMPWYNPGIMTEQNNWDLVAYILEKNGVGPLPAEINAGNAAEIRLK